VNIAAMIAQLRQELVEIDQAILTLQQLGQGQGKRRGRPPKWMKNLEFLDEPPKKTGRVAAGKGKRG